MSSGNMTADRRFAYAQLLRRDGDAKAAADVLQQTLELVPTWPECQFALAETLIEAGRKYDAIAVFETYLKLDSADSMGAAVKLALLTQTKPATLPAAYITRLFDEYAPRFEKSLIEKLNYRAPQILREALDETTDAHFNRVFDLGCGTGLAGVAVCDLAGWLGGVDLSAAMVKGAENKNTYDQLFVGDMLGVLSELEKCDLILAADVLTYVGDLAPAFTLVRNKLNARGLFAFTVQRHESEGFELGAEHRFSHSRAYIEALAAQSRFEIRILREGVSRQEKGADVPGLVAVLAA